MNDWALVAEFMPYFTSIKPIVTKCNSLIGSKAILTKISMELENLVAPLTETWASGEVVSMAWDMIDTDRDINDKKLESKIG